MKRLLIAASVLLAIVLLTSFSVAANEVVIHKFGLRTDGKTPTSGLVADAMGNLYGVTVKGGGPVNAGTVYQLAPPTSPGGVWTETVLYTFTGTATNGGPYGPGGDLAIDAQGNLFGVTGSGGSANAGTIFELSPPAQTGQPWIMSVLYTFTGLADGATPGAGLVHDPSGNFYGATVSGGTGNNGVVFELSPPVSPGSAWTETVLHAFQGTDGSEPIGKLVFDALGDLFGTTFAGGGDFNCNNGLIDCGTVFELSPPSQPGGSWTENVIHAFRGSDGQFPQAGLTINGSGQLAGTTAGGGFKGFGVVYGLQPPPQTGGHWNFKILHSFNGQPPDGASPDATLTLGVGGTLFGTTSTGGALGQGTVFQLSRVGCCSYLETGVYSFPGGNTGGVPAGGVLLLNGALYGTTALGGREDVGTAFKLTR